MQVGTIRREVGVFQGGMYANRIAAFEIKIPGSTFLANLDEVRHEGFCFNEVCCSQNASSHEGCCIGDEEGKSNPPMTHNQNVWVL